MVVDDDDVSITGAQYRLGIIPASLPSSDDDDDDDDNTARSSNHASSASATTKERRMYNMATEAAKQMSINELLTLLDGWDVRYPPHATRELLITVMLRYIRNNISSTDGGSPKQQGPSTIVIMDDNTTTRHHSHHSRRHLASKLESTGGNDDCTSFKRLKVDTRRNRRRRRRRDDYIRSINNNRRHSDSTADIDESESYYTNGLQIFCMGFVEASKTATRLATDAIVDSVGGRKGDDGRSATNVGVKRQQRRRRQSNVLDVDVIDYSPRQGLRTVVERNEGREENDADEERRKRRRCEDINESEEEKRPTLRKENLHRDNHYRTALSSNKGVFTRSHRCIIPSDDVEEDSSPKKIYGLYQPNSSIDTELVKKEESFHEQQQQQQQQQQQRWKDRLRHKFDIALGLEADSLRTQIEGMEDRRKNVLRRRMNENELNNDEQRGASRRDDPPLVVVEPNNRRARMRRANADNALKLGEQKPKASSSITPLTKTTTDVESSPKSRLSLDEVPFWRETGSIASLLFDAQSPLSYSGTRDGGARHPRRGKFSLEQFLLSPFGREHTVTSLFVYCSRSAITAFGILCRWAGVRGTIPQPIVVLTVIATVLSSRGGSRVMSLILTLLAMRLVAEFIHGSLNGNEFWDDEYDRNTHNWKKEIVK